MSNRLDYFRKINSRTWLNSNNSGVIKNEPEEKGFFDNAIDTVSDITNDIANGIDNNLKWVSNKFHKNNVDYSTTGKDYLKGTGKYDSSNKTANTYPGNGDVNHDKLSNHLSIDIPKRIKQSINLPESFQTLYDVSPIGLLSGLAYQATEFDKNSTDKIIEAGKKYANESTLEPNWLKNFQKRNLNALERTQEYNYNAPKSLINGISNTYGGIVDLFGLNTGHELNFISKKTSPNKNFSGNIFSKEFFTDPEGLTYTLPNAAGSMLALAPSAYLAPTYLMKLIQSTTNPMIRKSAELALKGAMTAFPESMSEGGAVVRDAKENNLDNPYLRGWATTMSNLPMLMGSNAIEYTLLGGKGINPSLGKTLPKRLKKAIAATGINAIQNGTEEFTQQGIQNKWTDKPYSFNPFNAPQDQIDAMQTGMIVGGGLSAVPSTIRATTGNPDFDKYINNASNETGIPASIIQAVSNIESSYNPNAVSEQGAIGYMQLMPETAKAMGVKNIKDPEQNIMGGAKYLKYLYDKYGNWRDTLIAYNEGEGNFDNGERFSESINYANNVLNKIEELNNISLPDKKYYNILGEVSDTGLTTLTEQKLNLLARDFYNKFGYNLDVTSMKRNGDGSSWHDSGQAIDVANDLLASDPEARAWLIKQGEKYGLTSLDEYTNPSANATGGHIHFSDHGEPIPGVSTQVDSAPNIDNSTANDFYNNDSYVLNNDYSNMKADDISLYEPAQAEHKTEKNDNSDLDTLSEDEKWDIVDEEIEKAQTDGNILYLDKLTKIKRNNNINALDNLIDNIKKTDKKFLTKLQAKRASNFTSEQQKKIDSAIQEQNKLYSENKTLEAAKKAEEIEHMKKGFMADNAFKVNKNKDNKPQFDTNKLKILGNNLLKQLEKSNNELQNTNPIVNYDKIKASLDSNDINRQRDAITAIQYLLNASNNDKKTSEAMLLEGLNNPNNRIANDWYNKINNNLDINNIKTLQKGETSKKEITIDNTENINSYIKNLIDNLNSSQDTLSQEDINRLYDSIKNKSLAENQEQKYQYDYSIEQLAKSIERAKKYKEFINSLSEEEALAMDYLDYTFKDTGKSFVDVLNLLKNEQEQDIQNYMEILRSQMKKGVVARSVYYNEKTDEYINSPGFSDNYQWYRDIMKARDYRPLGKNDIEGYLRDTAIEHLSYGYEDPQYGMQIPPEVANEFRRREDAINGLETIADKAKQYEQGRQLPRENQTSSRSNETNIQQKQKEIDIEATKNIGKLLFDKVQEKQLKVDLNNLEQAISSDNINRVNKANDFMQRKLEPILNNEEKQQIQKNLNDNKTKADIKKEDLSTSETQSIENNSEQSDINRSSFDLKANEVEQKNTNNKQNKSFDLAYGYLTESGKSLAEANENEFIIKSNGSRNFGEITSSISNATGGELTPGKIRLRVGNEKQGLIHAKKHEKQAKHIGYNSIEDMIADVAENFDVIYKKDNGKGKRATYSLVKLNDDNVKAKQNVVPTYFELQNEDNGYYIIITAIPKNIGSFKNQIKKETLIYSKQGQDIATISSDSAVRLSQSNNKTGVTEERLPISVKSNVSSNNIISNDNISDNQKKSEVNENELNDSSNTVVTRDKQGNDKDNVGTDDESHRSSREDGRDIRTNGGEGPRQDSSTSIRGDSTNIGGKTSDSTIRQEESANTDNSTRDTKLSRSVTDSYERPLVDETTTEGITDFVNESLFDESTIDKQKQINTKDIKVGNLESIKNDLPLLLPEQQDDVFKAETRMFVNNKPGMLFTNGTGTGKTFTGLGIVKRFVEQGKKNILIVSPSTGINDGWIDSGKKFGLNIVPLKNKKDNGDNNISITTLNNFTSNKTLVNRSWDLVVIDECHKLISNQNNKETGAIKNLRAITLNERGFNTRFDYLYPEENSNSELRIELKNQWKQIQEKDKPKVLFLSATPFSHVKNIDYAEGYLFNYDRQNGNLSTEEAHDKFFVKNFGYKIRYNRLEQPDPDVDNSIMEMEFHEKLKNDGAISSRRLVIDKDYDRGFILVDGGIGKKVDEGFEYLFNSKNNYTNLANFFNKSYGYYNKLFLLEAVKAREAIKLIKEYKKTGKKIVVFHRYLKNESKHPFKLSFDDEQFKSLTSYTKNRIKNEYERFCKERPDLVNLDLSELTSPIQTLTEAFGDKIAIYNGSLSAKEKNDSLSKFNDDNSEVDVILVQADAGSAGISLHDKTGKHQRVLINLGLPTKPVEAIQTEGRIYRVGQKTNAIFRYLNTGTSMERTAFATNIAQRSETVENLALGEEARNLKQSFVEAFQETINKLREKEDTIAKKREILKNFNSVRTGAMLSERADRYIFTIRNPLILELTAQYESADLDKIFHDLSIKNNGRDENIHYGSDKGEFYSWFKRDALNYCQYSFKSLSDMEAFSTEISEFYNDFLNKDFVIKQVLPDKIFVYITPKSSARELSITEIDKIAKKYGNLDAFERIRAYAYPFKTQEQASNFVKELKNIANSKPFSIEQEGALTKVTISNNFRFRNLITNINKNRKIKAIVEKHNGTYKGIGSSSVMVLKNTPYYFESRQKAEAFLEELNDIAKRMEYTDINIDDGNTHNSNNYFVLDDFKHTKTGEIYKRAYPIKYVDDFKTLITLAKKAGGFYSRYQSAGFLFATEQQRKSFLDAVNNVNNEEQDISNKLLKSYIGTHKDKESGGTIIGIKVPLNNRNYINYIEPALKKLDYQYVVKKPNNSRYHSVLLFKNEKEAKYLLNEIKENIRKDKFNKKYSGVGQMIPSLIDYDNLLTEDKLNRQEKALSDFGKIIGCPILYFNNDEAKNIRGAFSGGIMYLNRASNISPRWTFYHEFIHWLKGTNPEVFAEIRKAIGEVSAKRILEYRDEIIGGNDTFDGKPLLTDEDIIEEMIADHMYNTSTRVSLNKLMAKNNPTIWQRFVAFWHNLLDKFRALYSIPLGLDKEQGKNMNIAMEKLVTSIKNKDGQFLFKRTKNGLVFANNNETVLNNKEFKIKPVSIEVYSSQKEKLSSSKSNGFLDKMKLYWNGRKSTAKPIQIKQALELISGYTFEMGRIQTKDDVVINHVAKIIRTKKAFDYPAMLEGVSPILAEKLGFKNDMAMQQYIANYIFDVASARNDEVNYHKLVTAINNHHMMSEFNHLQSLFSDLKSLSARDKLRENRVSDDNMPKSGLKKLLHEMYLKNHDQWVDRYGPVKRMVDKFEKATGQKLEITNPYKQFRLVAGSAGTGIAFIEGKKGVVNQSLQAIFPNIDFSNFKSLQTILIDNGINKDSEKLEELADYSLAMYYKDNPKNKPSFMKNKDLDEVINTTDDNIKQAHKELIEYQFKLFELMTDAGLISRQQLREMRITHKNYVPMYKYFDENDNLLFRKEITKEENNDRLTVNPIEGVVVNTYKTMRIIAKNKAKLSLTTLANDKMIAPYIKIEQVANKGEDAKTTFSVMINGKKQTYKADKDIIDMMRDLDIETGSNFLKKIIYKISSIMRSVFTISNPEFGFSNFFRDLASVTYYNKYSMRPMDIWHGFSSFFHKDKYYWEYIASGAAQTAAVSMDRNYTQASLNKIYKHSWKSMARWKNLPQDILNIFQYISEASEMGLRIAHYRAGLRKMSVDKSINRQDIAYDTRDIMDFSRGGKAGRELNRYVLFANASIQGWSKFFRDVESYGLKYGLAKGGALLAYKITKYAILPALILFLLNKDDDKYKETPQWLRDTHWILPLGDKIIRIPKAMEPSILIISSLMERALNYSYNKDKEAFNNAHVLLFDQLPDIFPTLLKPLMETAANYSLFREGNIVPLSKQNDMPYMQYDEHTSGVSKMLGKAFNISPMKMDYLLYGYTGNYGRLATKVLDVSVIPKEYAQKKSFYDNLVSKENFLAWPWEDVVFLRRFMYTPYKNARSLTQFYEDFHYQQALYNEYKDTGVRPKEFNERYYERLKEAQKKMRDIKKMQQKIIDNTTQSANARQSSLDNVNKKRLDIARKALQYK